MRDASAEMIYKLSGNVLNLWSAEVIFSSGENGAEGTIMVHANGFASHWIRAGVRHSDGETRALLMDCRRGKVCERDGLDGELEAGEG
jgi:hypothetical protein